MPMNRNTVQVRSVKDMTQDEQNTQNLEAIAAVANAIEAGDQYVVAVLHTNEDSDGDPSCELTGSMSAGNLEDVAKMLSFQSVLGQVDDPQAFLDRIVASHSTEDVA